MKFKGRKYSASIVPANGWAARYRQPDGSILHVPLICWALTKGGADNNVEGMDAHDGEVDFCEDRAKFDGYAYQGEDK